MPHNACNAFHWIGQPMHTCDECAKPAWLHDFLESVDSESPFGGAWVQKPWAEEIVAFWERERMISSDRAEHLRVAKA